MHGGLGVDPPDGFIATEMLPSDGLGFRSRSDRAGDPYGSSSS